MPRERPLKICLATAEIAPLAKTGGLADVCSALSAYLHRAGHDVRVLLPRYGQLEHMGLHIEPVERLQDIEATIGHRRGRYSIDITELPGNRMPLFLLRCPELYAGEGIYSGAPDEYLRYVLLSRAAIEMCQRMNFAPDIFHVHDWHTAMAPLYLKTVYGWDRLFAATRSVLTIHNIGYQGVFSADVIDDLELRDARHHLHQEDFQQGRINFLKTGLLHADVITTVSPSYAEEIQGSDYGMGLEGILHDRRDVLIGILNGVDYAEWNPETDPRIPANYSRDDLSGKHECKLTLMRELGLSRPSETPLIGIVSRLVSQKGIDLIERVLPAILTERDVMVAVLGSGEQRFERFFEHLQQRHRDRVAFFRGYNEELAHWIEAGSDMFLMPSIYEPCGLNQMYSLRYGTLPIVRKTGGLADSVQPVDPLRGTGTGVLFHDYDETGLSWAIDTALELYADQTLWQKIIANGMAMDFSWEHQGLVYVDLFRRITHT